MNGGGHMHLTTFAILPILPPTPICCIFPQTNSSHVSFNLFPPFHPWSTLFTFSIHFMYHCLHQNIFLRSSQNMTILPHTIHPCQFFCCFLQSQHVHQLPCTPLFHQLYTAHCSHHRSLCSSQNSYFIFSQTLCFVSI